jgi:predicted flap endonuclease-1-like 5' DNA nuclease
LGQAHLSSRPALILEEENSIMLRKLGILFVLALSGLGLTGFSSPFAAMVEEEGNPWWIWLLILVVLVAFIGLVIWWWMRSREQEEVQELATPTELKAAATPPTTRPKEVQVEEPAAVPPPPPKPDDLKLIEGIGPKISSVLEAAGITTFAQLAGTGVDRIGQILEESNPNLLRLANPATWPEQAKLAAEGQWEALENLQDELTGGRRA